MRRILILLLTLLLISDNVFGNNGNRTASVKSVHTNHVSNKYKDNSVRLKRSLDDGVENIFSSSKENLIDDSSQYDQYLYDRIKNLKQKQKAETDSSIWNTKSRRESSSEETVPDVQLPSNLHKQNKYKFLLNFEGKPTRDQEISAFMKNLERSDESKDDMHKDLFWANRGRRQDDDPFWGTRGRREEDSPFWGNRGRRQTALLRKLDEEEEPFWGNRGRRQESDPFWGNRGRRETYDPLWSIHSIKNNAKIVESNKDKIRQKNELKDAIIESLNDVENKITYLTRNRRDSIQPPYWINRGRDSKMSSLFNGIARNRMQYNPINSNKYTSNELRSKTFQQNTVHDDRIYAEEPHYILVDRSSRSSAEEDPFFISRGKKHNDYNLSKAIRDRRGALEEIVKSVRNDPYYIARGKKDYIQIGNSTIAQGQFIKTKDLICAIVDLLMTKYNEDKVKREATDNERDRRTILKKLALQLQMDPYFVSRGKKSVDMKNNNPDTLEQFINKVVVLCN